MILPRLHLHTRMLVRASISRRAEPAEKCFVKPVSCLDLWSTPQVFEQFSPITLFAFLSEHIVATQSCLNLRWGPCCPDCRGVRQSDEK